LGQGACCPMTEISQKKKERVDGQITNLAGEFFVAGELLKHELQTSVTFGNAKAIDLFAHNGKTGKNFTVQVKAIRRKAFFPIKPSSVKRQHIYVFVLLNKPGEAVQYFIVPGDSLADEPGRFGKDYAHPTFPGIHPKSLKDFENAWHYFDE
jgi:hypothetical protein